LGFLYDGRAARSPAVCVPGASLLLNTENGAISNLQPIEVCHAGRMQFLDTSLNPLLTQENITRIYGSLQTYFENHPNLLRVEREGCGCDQEEGDAGSQEPNVI